MTDEEYAQVSSRVKVLLVPDHAIDFCYECGFEFTVIRGYRLTGGDYRFDQAVTDDVLDSPW